MNRDTYSPVEGNGSFLDGFTRVNRARESRIMSPQQRQAVAVREARVAAAADFMADLMSGATPAYWLREMLNPSSSGMTQQINESYPGLIRKMTVAESSQAAAIYGAEFSEAQTTSDFPLLVGDVLDRMLLQRFNEAPQVWREYISVGRPLRDFRTARMITTDGGDGRYAEIPEEGGLTYTTLTETGYTITPALYGKAVKLSWRLLINDDLDAFAELPAVLGRGGRRTISRYATDLLFDANGPDATFVSAGNGNLITGNPVLSIASLGTAIQQLAGFVDDEGEPIVVEGVKLVHGPGLRVTVQNLLNQLTVDVTSVGGTNTQTVRVANWIISGMTAVEDPYIPIIATTNGATSWMLVADPNVNRPAARVRFLAGFEQPALFQKMPNTMRLGGGVDNALGDFQSMSQEWKGLIAFGGTTIEPKSLVGSNGSGA
jgi:hypothetical protein